MTMMTEHKGHDHTVSDGWHVFTRGSEDYQAKIGLLRMMYRLKDDPRAVAILTSKNRVAVEMRFDNGPWERIHG